MDRAEVEARIGRTLRDFEGVVSLYLFGSFAEGREHGESDVDVGILLDREYYPTETQRFDQRVRRRDGSGTAHRSRPAI